MNNFKIMGMILFTLLIVACMPQNKSKQNVTAENLNSVEKQDVIAIIERVNDYWQTNNPEHGRAFWIMRHTIPEIFMLMK